MTHTIDNRQNTQDEYITIIARTVADAMRQFKAKGLDQLGFAIVGPVDKHQFSLADGTDTARDMFEGAPMIAATFKRSTATQ